MSLLSRKKKKSLPDFASWVSCLSQANEDFASSKPETGLYLTATPIGNLGDISLRALWTLARADLILCEDTRTSGAMLARYGVKVPLLSCHNHNEEKRIDLVSEHLEKGDVLALISDAGTPMVSDPGFRLVRALREKNLPVFALPGASACLTALASAGLPSDRFLFIGFLPAKQSARRKEIEGLVTQSATMIFYEAPTRLAATLEDLAALFGTERRAALARELTKLYEEVSLSTLGDLASLHKEEKIKGEIVILVEGAAPLPATETNLDALLADALKTLSVKDAAAEISKQTGIKKSAAYKRALFLKEN